MRISPIALSGLLVLSILGCSSSSDDETSPTSSSPSASSEAGDASSEAAVSSSSSSSSSADTLSQVCGLEGPLAMPEAVEDAPSVKCIVVDQFGYRPQASKVAVLRDPEEGFDGDVAFSPGETYAVVNVDTQQTAFSGTPGAWNGGEVNSTSGDRAWWFDFSSVTDPGRYVVLDEQNAVRSPVFEIADNIYRPILVEAVRTFFYQRAGHAKPTPYAEPGWADSASHLGEGQDTEARLYNATDDADTERDLSGGWYDAGDYNKYSNWHAGYLIEMMHIYRDRPSVWTDDFNIPESGNGIPDLVDEIKWGMDWLIKMQEDNGSVLSVMGLDHGSPPSAADGPSVYGPATTSATLSSAAAFAFGADFFDQFENEALSTYADDLRQRALDAWQWAEANPSETFRNSDNGVAAGEQEVNAEGRADKRLIAAVYLFDLTGEAQYRDYVDDQVPQINWVSPWNETLLHTLLHYASVENATASVAEGIENQYVQAMQGAENWAEVENQTDPYRAFIGDGNFTWGSNRTMAKKGNTFYNLAVFGLGDSSQVEIDSAALGYIHYLHGTNAMGKVYLSNMSELGAEDSVDSFYHSWFTDGSANWDSASESSHGPAPGFLVGGANPSYDWDSCCPDGCGSSTNNAMCGMAPPSPPHGQPPQKSYLDFNDGWPLNSWSVTENANGYQTAYIRLLSKFVE